MAVVSWGRRSGGVSTGRGIDGGKTGATKHGRCDPRRENSHSQRKYASGWRLVGAPYRLGLNVGGYYFVWVLNIIDE
jgi:hypothetical protein